MKKTIRHIFSTTLLVVASLVGLPLLAQTETLIHSFNNADGDRPLSSLVYDSTRGLFYGTTWDGGATNSGVVFALSENGTGNWIEDVLYSFQGSSKGDCSNPNYGVTPSYSNGAISALYGTCDSGGGQNLVVVFSLVPGAGNSWTEHIVYSFKSPIDGADPRGGVAIDAHGNLYGTTNGGGTLGGGTAYRLKPSGKSWVKTVLHNFASGSYPEGQVVLDQKDDVYGTTSGDFGPAPAYSGTIFQLVPPGAGKTHWVYHLLHAFNGGDGADPRGALIGDSSGALYGTTESGGSAGLGTVFKLLPPSSTRRTWKLTELYSFTVVTDAAAPVAGLTFGRQGVLYGTTSAGERCIWEQPSS